MSPSDFSRRQALIGGAVVTAAAASVAATSSAQAAPPAAGAKSEVLKEWRNPKLVAHLQQAPKLLNVERAHRVMDKYGLDGLVAAVPHNIYYLSSHMGPMQMMGRGFSTYAFYPRNPEAPPALIVPGSMVYHLDYRPTWMPLEIYTYAKQAAAESMAAGMVGSGDAKAAGAYADPIPSPWALNVRREGMEDRDRLLMAIYAQYEGDTTVSALAGLAKSIKKAGVTRGKIGFDDPRVGAWLQQEGLKDIKVHDAANTFREIRMVKTPVEVEILRQAAQKNEDALLYAINNTSVGQSLDDIEFAHGKRWGELGGSTLWCITNQRGIASGVIAPNTVTKIDSVGQYKAYRGDVGRTVVWGTASDEVMKRNEANTKALRITYDAIHPGMTFGESSKIMRDVMQQAGISRGGGGAHPVGLEHTDHPWPTGAEQSPDELFTNFVYEENMVFTMDVPYHEVGYGTSHVEDMMVVKKTKGCEGLSSMDTRLIVRPA